MVWGLWVVTRLLRAFVSMGEAAREPQGARGSVGEVHGVLEIP